MMIEYSTHCVTAVSPDVMRMVVRIIHHLDKVYLSYTFSKLWCQEKLCRSSNSMKYFLRIQNEQ